MRVFDRIVAVVLALAFVVVGVLVVVDVVAAAFGDSGAKAPIPYERPDRWLHGHTWSATPVVIGLIVLAAIGLILLITELRPRTPGLLTLHSEVDGVTVGAPRRSLSRAMSRVASGVDGISNATTALGTRSAKVLATTHLRDTTGLSDQVCDAVTEWLTGLGLERPPRVKVSLTQKER
jgi:hypothetical protein